MEFKLLVKNTSFLASTKFVQFIAGVFRSKINALVLGTTGVGVYDQLAFLANRMYLMTTLQMGEAVVKQIASNKDSEKISQTINTSLKSYILLSAIFLMISSTGLLFFRDWLTELIFGDIKYKNYYFFAILTIPILIINSIPFSILKSFKDVKTISRARIGTILVNLIIFLPLIYFFELNGAVISLPISFIVTGLFNYSFARKNYFQKYNISMQSIISAPLSRAFSKEILIFSGFGLVIAIYGIFNDFYSRSLIVSNFGVDQIGIFSPITKWFGLFTGFIMPSFTTYLFPRYSSVSSNFELSGIINDSLRLCTLMILPLLTLAIPFRYFFIELFYSKQFMEAGLYLPFSFFGRVFFIWFFAMTISLKPMGRIQYHAFLFMALYTINILVSYFFIPMYGLYGYILSNTFGAFVLFFVVLAFLNRTSEFRIYKANLALMIYMMGATLLLIIIDFYFSKPHYNYFLGPLFLISTFFILTINEKKQVVKKVSSFAKIFKK